MYEPNVRIRDPVYGCAGVIFHLHKQVTLLQEQLAKTQAELGQQSNLIANINMEMAEARELVAVLQQQLQHQFLNTNYFDKLWGLSLVIKNNFI